MLSYQGFSQQAGSSENNESGAAEPVAGRTTDLTCNNWLRLTTFPAHVSVGDLDIPGQQITLEAVFMRTAPYSNGYNWAGDLISKHNNPPDVNYLLRPNNTEITTTNGFYTTPPICEIELNKVYHVAMTYDGATLKFYRNGFLMSSVPATGNLIQNNFQTRIGLYDALVNNTQMIGYINEVRIWNVVRTQAQLRATMNTSLPNPTTQPGLLAYYTFDNLLNKQGNATWTGVIGGTAGAATINQTIPNCTFIADSCARVADCDEWLLTPVQGSKVVIGDADVSGNKLTVEAMFNRTQPLNNGLYYGSLVSKHTNTTDANYSLLPNGCEITTSVSGYKAIFQNCPLNLNETYHVAMVYDGATLKYYRDGFLLSEIPCTGNLVTNNLSATIGQIASGTDPVINQFLGNINEVRIWNVARTQTEIKTFMNALLPNPATQGGLVAYYSFNNLLNKQGNAAFHGAAMAGAQANRTNPNCDFIPDTCFVPSAYVINDYTPVSSLDICKNTITVIDASEFNAGDTVLLIQMKGAIIDSTNTAAYGNVTNFRNAGNYEYNYIKSKTGNLIELRNAIERPFDLPDGKVQLVRVPYFANYTVSAKLTCLPWDGDKGGVLAFNVNGVLSLNENIDVSGKGFRGGAAIQNPLYGCNIDSFYLANNDGKHGGLKGEGIFSTQRLLSGRGKSANGGGGGNSVNSGGAGGSNAGRGGEGGKQYSGAACNPNFTNGGVGGLNLPYSNADNKIYMGGGGGAGQMDDSKLGGGGNGGGIVIIHAGSIQPNTFSIKADGDTPEHLIGTNDDGRSGGGAGGTVLLNYTSVSGTLTVSAKGGKGDDCIAPPAQNLHGTGGGGGGGVVWTSGVVNDPTILTNVLGGMNGTHLAQANNPWGATVGSAGTRLHSLVIPVADIPFKPNIDSVRIRTGQVSCKRFDFEGLTYVNTTPVASWQWYFGDSNTANTANASHEYAAPGSYDVKLVATDMNGCKDSITINVQVIELNFDFTYAQDVCNPLTVRFTGVGNSTNNTYWHFGDGNSTTNTLNPSHTYGALNNYIVKYSVMEGGCRDTIQKEITIAIQQDDIINTRDTLICYGASKMLLTKPALDFCWTPADYLDNPLSPNPVTSTPENITYYFTAQIPGSNLIVNGDFSQGNTGFTTSYSYKTPPNTTEGQYYIGSSPQAWHSGFSNCPDHTSGTGNMMIINGSPVANTNVWGQQITVTPNTNYTFSLWLQSLIATNPAQLQFSINGRDVGSPITANNTTCSWKQFFTTWNSGNSTTATISIVNKNTVLAGNDFAIDDIVFAPVLIKRDSVKITVEKPLVVANNDTTVCAGNTVNLAATGAQTYSWTPAATLNNPGVANPVATPLVYTEYIVNGTTVNGCSAKDTVVVDIFAKPLIATANDTTICRNGTAQLFVSGGDRYTWTPAATLSNPSIANPLASPASDTRYYVNIVDDHTCAYIDSVDVFIKPPAVFTINNPGSMCRADSVRLIAGGGDIYSWQPAASLSNPAAANPWANPAVNTTYSVTITESVCNESTTLSAQITVMPTPTVTASKSNDIDCTVDFSQLSATGASRYTWSPSATLTNPSIANPVARPVVSTEYQVKGTDANGCSSYDTVLVKVENINKSSFLMPTAFTPNNDGLNDCYGIRYWGIVQEFEFSIYNRWGERIFYTKDPNKCWDGTYKGVKQDSNVFVYMIKAKTTCENEVFRKGTFTLIR